MNGELSNEVLGGEPSERGIPLTASRQHPVRQECYNAFVLLSFALYGLPITDYLWLIAKHPVRVMLGQSSFLRTVGFSNTAVITGSIIDYLLESRHCTRVFQGNWNEDSNHMEFLTCSSNDYRCSITSATVRLLSVNKSTSSDILGRYRDE